MNDEDKRHKKHRHAWCANVSFLLRACVCVCGGGGGGGAVEDDKKMMSSNCRVLDLSGID